METNKKILGKINTQRCSVTVKGESSTAWNIMQLYATVALRALVFKDLFKTFHLG
jgi:hypothetical protein